MTQELLHNWERYYQAKDYAKMSFFLYNNPDITGMISMRHKLFLFFNIPFQQTRRKVFNRLTDRGREAFFTGKIEHQKCENFLLNEGLIGYSHDNRLGILDENGEIVQLPYKNPITHSLSYKEALFPTLEQLIQICKFKNKRLQNEYKTNLGVKIIQGFSEILIDPIGIDDKDILEHFLHWNNNTVPSKKHAHLDFNVLKMFYLPKIEQRNIFDDQENKQFHILHKEFIPGFRVLFVETYKNIPNSENIYSRLKRIPFVRGNSLDTYKKQKQQKEYSGESIQDIRTILLRIMKYYSENNDYMLDETVQFADAVPHNTEGVFGVSYDKEEQRFTIKEYPRDSLRDNAGIAMQIE